jgi:hypothetical protein
MAVHAINLVQGFSTTYYFSVAKKKENNLRERSDYYGAAFTLLGEYAFLQRVINQMPKSLFQRFPLRSFKVLCNASFLSKLVFCCFTACVRKGEYGVYAEKTTDALLKFNNFNDVPPIVKPPICWAALHIPQSLPSRAVSVVNFCFDHAGDFAKVAMVVSSLAFLYFGSYVYGASMLGGFAFQELSQRGCVPQKMEFFVEKYMPMFGAMSVLTTKTRLFIRVNAALMIIAFIPPINRYVIKELDQIIKDFERSVKKFKEKEKQKQEEDPLFLPFCNMGICYCTGLKRVLSGYDSVSQVTPDGTPMEEVD